MRPAAGRAEKEGSNFEVVSVAPVAPVEALTFPGPSRSGGPFLGRTRRQGGQEGEAQGRAGPGGRGGRDGVPACSYGGPPSVLLSASHVWEVVLIAGVRAGPWAGHPGTLRSPRQGLAGRPGRGHVRAGSPAVGPRPGTSGAPLRRTRPRPRPSCLGFAPKADSIKNKSKKTRHWENSSRVSLNCVTDTNSQNIPEKAEGIMPRSGHGDALFESGEKFKCVETKFGSGFGLSGVRPVAKRDILG